MTAEAAYIPRHPAAGVADRMTGSSFGCAVPPSRRLTVNRLTSLRSFSFYTELRYKNFPDFLQFLFFYMERSN